MAVEPALSAPAAPSLEPPVAGARATTATTVIRKASEKVVGSINLKAMQQSFPDFLESEDDRQFIQLLTDKTGQHLSAGFEVRQERACKQQLMRVYADRNNPQTVYSQEAWKNLMVNSEYKDFTARANQVDNVFAAATQRRARREEPQDAWK